MNKNMPLDDDNDRQISLNNEKLVENDGNVKKTTTIYIGNLDKRMREIHILKLFQPMGKITNLQFLFTKTGEPRGYMFITFAASHEAEQAVQKMNGRIAMGRPLVVRYAIPPDQKKKMIVQKPPDKQEEIIAIQNKLKQLEKNQY